MFGWLKRFRKEKPIKTELLRFSDLDAFIKEEERRRVLELEEKLSLLRNQSQERLAAISDSIAVLENASLLNENIPERAKAVMQGNKEEFIRRAKTVISLKLPDNHANWLEFFSAFSGGMHDFATGSMRPLAILREFFEHEANSVAMNIASLQKGLLVFNEEYNRSMMAQMPALYGAIAEINRIRNAQKAAIEDKQRLQKMKDSILKEKENLESESAALESSDDFSQINSLRKQLESIVSQRKSLRQGFLDRFGSLENALRKYEKISFNDSVMIQNYLSNPVDAIINDSQLKILKILEGLKASIEKDSVDLKDQRREKTLAVISELTPAMIMLFLKTNNSLKQQEDSLLQQINEHKVLQEFLSLRKQVKELQQKLASVDSDIEQCNKDWALDGKMEQLAEKVFIITGKKMETALD